MAKVVRKRDRKQDAKRRSHAEVVMPLRKHNFMIIALGLVVIALGYVAMLEGSVEGFLPLVVAPLLLVIGYCVIIPFGILYRPTLGSFLKRNEGAEAAAPAGEAR